MLKRLTVGLAIAAASLVMAPLASAVTVITVDDTATTDKFKQTDNNPCIIARSCGTNGGLTYSLTPNGPGDYVVFSPSYDASLIISTVAGTSFIVAVDVNTAGPDKDTHDASEDLLFFEMCIGGAVSGIMGSGGDAWCTGGTIVASTDAGGDLTYDLHDYMHGNGESDLLLIGFDLLTYAPLWTCGNGTELCADMQIQFRVSMEDTTDGFESFFLISAESTPIPEPGILGLLGVGLLGIGLANRRRRKQRA